MSSSNAADRAMPRTRLLDALHRRPFCIDHEPRQQIDFPRGPGLRAASRLYAPDGLPTPACSAAEKPSAGHSAGLTILERPT